MADDPKKAPSSAPPAKQPSERAATPTEVVSPESEAFPRMLRDMLRPIAEAETAKSQNDLEAHKTTVDYLNKVDSRSHHRSLIILVVGGILLLMLAAFAFYAYVQGDKETTKYVLVGLFSYLAGGVSGYGVKAGQQRGEKSDDDE